MDHQMRNAMFKPQAPAPVAAQPYDRRQMNANQVILQSKVRVSQSGVEMIDFVVPLGVIELHCSCPIPDEGTDGSPVYVHIRQPRTVRQPRPFSNRQNRDFNDEGQEGDDEGQLAYGLGG
jgi:hypothetical protein